MKWFPAEWKCQFCGQLNRNRDSDMCFLCGERYQPTSTAHPWLHVWDGHRWVSWIDWIFSIQPKSPGPERIK